MLTLREPQMQALREAAASRFEDEMVAHLNAFAPRHCEVIGERWLRETVRRGRTAAAGHGFDRRGPVRCFLELMFLHGSAFDTDPQLPWAAACLAGGTPVDQMQRAGELFDRSRDYLVRVAGPANIHSISALRLLRDRANRPIAVRDNDLEETLLNEMALIFPEKAYLVGEPPLRLLIRQAGACARAMGAMSVSATALFAVLAFALGHGYQADPLFPWIRNTLHDSRIQGPEQRLRRLGGKAITYLDHALRHLDSTPIGTAARPST